MHPDPDANEPVPYWSVAGLWLGIRYALPLAPAAVIFATVFGSIAVQKGLTLTEAALMSALVFGGVAQLVALDAWTQPMTWEAIAAATLATGVVNSRFFLMNASFRRWLGSLPAAQIYPMLLLTTDSSWIIGTRHQAEGGSNASVLLGAGVFLWVLWVLTSMLGYLAGALAPQPQRFGIDLILPIVFAIMFVPLWRGAGRAIPWAIAGAVALVVQHLVPGYWFMIAGALAGAISGGFIDERN